MAFQVDELLQTFAGLVVTSENTTSAEFARIDSIEDYSTDSLVFIDTQAQLPKSSDTLPAVVVTRQELVAELAEIPSCLIVVNNVRLAQAKIKQTYQEYDSSDSEWGSIHSSAIIHPTAKLGENVRIGPNVVVGANVDIGAGTHIRANAVIEHGVRIGDNGLINAHVNIGYDCVLGDRVNIHSGVVIGNEGFGFAQDDERNYHRIPHTGVVRIGNDVQIGANSNIDRGTYQATVIGNGVKLDSQCHIAHNVHIDDGTLLAAQACIAGSTYIGKRVMASGQVGVLDHLSIADDTVLVHRSGVTDNISEPGMYAGVPAKPFKEYVRGMGVDKRIERINKQIKELKQKVFGQGYD